MESFLSANTIHIGDRFPQKILEFLIETDVLFVVLDPLVSESKWVQWEYDFCDKREIKIIPIALEGFHSKLREKVKWFDDSTTYCTYDGNDAILRYKVWNVIDNMKDTLESRASERKAIKLEARLGRTSEPELGKVKISGKVKSALIGTAYLHMPSSEDTYPPIRTREISTSITPNSEGGFEFEFALPHPPVRKQRTQKWFIEIKFGKKSKLIPISMNVEEGEEDAPGGAKPPGVSSGLQAEGGSATQIKEKISSISRGTHQSIPRTIKGQTISRDDKVSDIVNLLDQNDRVVVTGDKGSGKSALMCQLYEKLSKQHDVLFLRCDDYLGIDSLEQLNESIILGYCFADLIHNIASESNKLTIIFDSLDAISRNKKSMNVFKHFLKSVWGTNKVQTVSSVRSYDYEYSPDINATDWGKRYRLELLKTEELDKALANLGNPKISDELKSLLNNPLHLKLLSLILERSPNADFTNIKNEIELYDEYWNEYVEKLDRAADVRSTLYDIAQKMSSLQRISIPYSGSDNPEAMKEILSRNIVLYDESSGLASFFHHAYLDYVTSRLILEEHGEFVDYLQQDEYNVFLRPTVVFALSILHKRDPKQSIKVIEGMLNSELKYFWKISALTALAGIDKSDGQDFAKLGRFLTDQKTLQRHFLMELTRQKNHFWFDLWKDSIFVKWSSLDHPNSWFIADYLNSIMGQADDHQSVFKIIHLIVANSNGWTKRKAVELLTEIDVAEKADWLHKLSADDDTHIRMGVVETLPKLIETNPESVPDIFCNLFTHVVQSDDTTHLASYGTFTMTSTKMQDSHMVVWRAGELFPELLKKNPTHMILSAIKVIESLRKNELDAHNCSIVEDHGHMWFVDARRLRDENKLLHQIVGYLHNCKDEELHDLIPTLNSTKLATFHSILIDALVARDGRFVEELFKILSNPEVYEIVTLRSSVRSAINAISASLSQERILTLLDNIMNIGPTDRASDESMKALSRVKAGFLSDFPAGSLQPEHREILDMSSKQDPKYEPPHKFEVKLGEAPETISDPEPEEVITDKLGKELEWNEKIGLLDAISAYLGKETAELDDAKLLPIKEFLISSKNDPDPKEDSSDGGRRFSVGYSPSIRGLAARCLIRLLCHTKDPSLVPLIIELSDDPISTVRAEVCRALGHLFYYDYDMTFSIAKRYSTDEPAVQFFLRYVLIQTAHKNPKHAALIISNMLSTPRASHERLQGIEDILIFLAFNKKEPDAVALLDSAVGKQSLPSEIRGGIPFCLKEDYLFKDEYQAQSLDLLYRLLDDPDHEVREKAAFFTLRSFEDELANNEELIKKIFRHLDRIIYEADREDSNPRLLEELVRFLAKFWSLLPEKTICYLEKLIGERIKKYTSYQAVIASESVTILNGLFQHPSLSKENRERCLDILDVYAMAGWKDALELLSAMERRD